MTNIKWQDSQIIPYSSGVNSIIPPNVDTTYPISPYADGVGYFAGNGNYVYLAGSNPVVFASELNWSTTNNFTLEFLYRPISTAYHYIAGKNYSTAGGWFLKYNSGQINGKDVSIYFVGLGYKVVCYITDTTIYHKIKIVWTKSDSTLKTYHGDGVNPDTLVNTYRNLVWNSNYHAYTAASLAIGGGYALNSDCSGTATPLYTPTFKGYFKYFYLNVNDTAYFCDFRPYFKDHIYDSSKFMINDRPYTANSKHWFVGNTYTHSRNDIVWVGDTTRLYPMLWDNDLFIPGLDHQYILDSNLCEPYINSKPMALYFKDTLTVICGGQISRANNNTWNAHNYNYISPRVARWSEAEDKWKSVGYGFNQLGGSISRAFDTLNNQVYIGGNWSRTYADTTQTTLGDSMNNICKFDLDTGTTVTRVGKGMNSQALEIQNFNNAIYVGGSFSKVFQTDGTALNVNYVAKWDGATWSKLGVTGVNNAVWAIQPYNGNLVIGGDFTDRGTRIAMWDGSAWSNPFGAGLPSTVYDIIVDDYGTLWACGIFGIAKWNGSSWIQIAELSALGASVTEIKSVNNALFFTGLFTRVNGKFMRNIGCYNIETGEFINIGSIDMRGEGLVILKNFKGKNWLVYFGDGLNVLSDGIRFGNVAALDLSKLGIFVGTEPGSNNIPKAYILYQNYPNPFNPVTNLRFDIPAASLVKLVIYDVLGREVKVLVNEFKNPGTYLVKFDGSQFASGVYFYKIEAGDFVGIKKMVLVK